MRPLPKIVFVLGKGGVGRSTVAAALGLSLAARGERVLVVEWTIAEAIAPWFGLPPAESAPLEVSPRLSVCNYRLDDVLRSYFVDHLGLGLFYRGVVANPHVQRLIEAAPGIAELLYLGQLWWLTTLAPEEAGLQFDRVIADTPATGHGVSLLDLPATLTSIGASGLLALEVTRVVKMMTNPAETGAVVVTTPEELAAEEALETIPRVARDLGRPALAVIVNRSVGQLLGPGMPADLHRLESQLPPDGWQALLLVQGELSRRREQERLLRERLLGSTAFGTLSLHEQLMLVSDTSPRAVLGHLAAELAAQLEMHQ